MRYLACPAILVLCALPALAQEKEPLPEYPLRCNVKFAPNSIHYGDLVFATVRLTNEGSETLAVPTDLNYSWRSKSYRGCRFYLVHDGERKFEWTSSDIMEWDEGLPHADGVWTLPGHSLRPGESIEIGFRPLWAPLPEFADSSTTLSFKKDVSEGEGKYRWDASIDLVEWILVGPLGDPPFDSLKSAYLSLKGIRPHELREHGYSFAGFSNLDGGELTIQPRSDEELALLHEWFLELPETIDPHDWYINGVFAHPYHVRNSPCKVSPAMQESDDTYARVMFRHERHEEYMAFFESMKTRTPQAELRIARTKELERQLLDRADRPNSTISPMMKEFIILRGHLVDIRYALDAADREQAFDVLLDWVATTHHRDLWRKYLKRVILSQLSHPDVVPPEVFDAYRTKLDERLPDED